MRRMLISLAAMATLTTGAYAQSPAPAAAPSDPASHADAPAQPAAKADAAAPTDTTAQTKAAGDGSATQWTYKTKDGQMYEPPKQRPASPAMDLSVYGRT